MTSAGDQAKRLFGARQVAEGARRVNARRPVVLVITGGSAAGKTTLTEDW